MNDEVSELIRGLLASPDLQYGWLAPATRETIRRLRFLLPPQIAKVAKVAKNARHRPKKAKER